MWKLMERKKRCKERKIRKRRKENISIPTHVEGKGQVMAKRQEMFPHSLAGDNV